MKPIYHTVDAMLSMIDEPNRSACRRMYADNRALFQTVPGSTNNHQNWPGGYIDHVGEAMNIAVVLYGTLEALRPFPCSLSDVLLVVFLHDVEKPWKYELRADGQLYHRANMPNKEACQRFRMEKLAEYGIVLTPEQENGLQYAEGELNDYTNRRRVMGPLACVAHMCDIASARLWFDCPRREDDPWTGAVRIRDC